MAGLIRPGRKSADDHFSRPRRFQLAGIELEALDRRWRGVVQIAAAKADACRAIGAELFLHVDLPVAVGVAQAEDVTGLRRLALCARARPQRQENIAVWRDDQRSRFPQVV